MNDQTARNEDTSHGDRHRLIGYLRVASAEADLMGDSHLRDRIDTLLEGAAGLAVEAPASSVATVRRNRNRTRAKSY